MFDSNHISAPPRSSIILESLKGILFYTIFVLYGILRLTRAALLFCLNILTRIGLSALFYFSLLVLLSLALVIVLSYYLIGAFGSQVRLP